MSLNHLLSLSALHAAAPGVLGVIFGHDGEFEGAPRWNGHITSLSSPRIHGPLSFWTDATDMMLRERKPRSWGRLHIWFAGGLEGMEIADAVLDLRVRSVAQRLASLCCRAADPRKDIHTWQRAADLADRAARCEWLDDYAATLASLTLTLAPRIAALKGTL